MAEAYRMYSGSRISVGPFIYRRRGSEYYCTEPQCNATIKFDDSAGEYIVDAQGFPHNHLSIKSDNPDEFAVSSVPETEPANHLQIRALTKDDFAKAKELASLSFPEYSLLTFEESFADSRMYSVGIVSSNNDDPLIGLIIAMPDVSEKAFEADMFPVENDARVSYISYLAVHPDYLRNGLASKLLEKFVADSKKLFPLSRQIYLEVETLNKRGIKFYEKHGFVRDSFVENAYKNNLHAYTYVRNLDEEC